MRFVDFSIRAWREGPYVQVMAHSTPAGAMRQPSPSRSESSSPTTTASRSTRRSPTARISDASSRDSCPPEVWRLLGESLAGIGSRRELGLRIRLCLDDDLIDLPWKFLYRPDVDAPAAQSGFLLTDGRISLTREPPSIVGCRRPRTTSARAVSRHDVGRRLGRMGRPERICRASRRRWSRSVELLKFEFAARTTWRRSTGRWRAAATCSTTPGTPTSRTDRRHAGAPRSIGDAQRVRPERLSRLAAAGHRRVDGSNVVRRGLVASEVLATRLAHGGTRLAVFNACNSGLWPFVRPLMRAGIPAVVGVQGLVSNTAALNFAEKFYQSLAVGLSLDEAMTYARLYVMQPGAPTTRATGAASWPTCPADSAVLFPRPERAAMRKRQDAVRAEREQTVGAMPKGQGSRWRGCQPGAVGSREPQRSDPRPLQRDAQAGAGPDPP